jgi:hypothetical protein
MADATPDPNDQALTGHFLRGMSRFQKFVRSQDIFGSVTAENVRERIDAAYQEALNVFTARQKGTKQ